MMDTATTPELFFRSVYQVFEGAENTSGSARTHFYSIGGSTVKLRFANDALVPRIAPAFEHLSVQETLDPALTVCLFDTVSTGAEIPSRPWDDEDYLARGEVGGYNNGRIHTSFDVGASILNLFDTDSNKAVFWIRDARQLPYWETGSPLRVILHWWLRQNAGQFLHAAAVGLTQGGVLLAGRGGSGKSTTALACLNAGLQYVADDYCLLTTKPAPYLHSLYSSGKVGAADRGKFPDFAKALYNAGRLQEEKALFFFYRHFPKRVSRGFPLKAIVIPRITGKEETTVTPATPMQALKALAPSTIFQLAGAGHHAFQTIAHASKQLPCYHLELGMDLENIPRVITGVLHRLGCDE